MAIGVETENFYTPQTDIAQTHQKLQTLALLDSDQITDRHILEIVSDVSSSLEKLMEYPADSDIETGLDDGEVMLFSRRTQDEFYAGYYPKTDFSSPESYLTYPAPFSENDTPNACGSIVDDLVLVDELADLGSTKPDFRLFLKDLGNGQVQTTRDLNGKVTAFPLTAGHRKLIVMDLADGILGLSEEPIPNS